MELHLRRGLSLAIGLGVGIGLMIGAVAVTLRPKPPMTDAQVIERAKALGMVNPTEMPPQR